MEADVLVKKISTILEEKKAKEIKTIDIKDISVLADYFIICGGTSTTHIKALADEVEVKLEEEGVELVGNKQGYNTARWILLDYGWVIVHIFHEEDRAFYNLEKLWADGKIVEYSKV